MNDPPEDDVDLWRRIRNGDADAFGELFARHGPRIHRYALRRIGDPATAEDVTAAVFLEAWRQRATTELRHPTALPWLYGVAGNMLRHWSRSRHRHQAALGRLAQLPPPSPALVDRQAEAIAESARVVEQIGRLPKREREVLVLSVWEGLSHAEIASTLDISVGTVKSRLSRARVRLAPPRDRPESPPPAAGPTPAILPAALTLKDSRP